MKRAAVFLLPLIATAQQQPVKLTLAEAVEQALKNNPQVDAARLDALASGKVVTQIRSNFFPQLTGTISGTEAPDSTRVILGSLSNPAILTRFGTGVTVNQLLTDFGRTSKLAESATFRARSDQQLARGTRAQIVLQVNQAYMAALRAKAIQQVAEKTLATRQTILDQVNALAANRIRSELDVRFAEVSVQEARLLLTTAINDRHAADADLSAALGLRMSQQFELADTVPPANTDLDAGRWIDEAIRQNPELEQRRYLLESALSQEEAEKRAFFPTISAAASAGVVPVHSPQFVRDNYAAIGFNIGIPVYTGKLLSSRREEAQLRAESVRKSLNAAENRIVRNISVALLNIRNAQERVQLAQQMAEQSQQALELARTRYELGLSSIVEFTQAQLALVNAQIQISTAQYDVEVQQAVLSFHAGTTP